MDTKRFFTNIFNNLTPEELEDYHKTVFMYMDTPFAMGKRIRYYQTRLKHMGKNVRIGCGVKIANPQYIWLGDSIEIGDNCVLAAFSRKGIILNDGTRLKHGVYLDTTELDTGYIKTGRRAFLGAGCCLYGHRGLEIADDSLLAQGVLVVPYSHRFDDPNKNIFGQVGYSRKITIGRDCYIGMNTCILYSADIGEGSVVGAGSVVVHTIPPYSVAVGVPARVIRKRGKN